MTSIADPASFYRKRTRLVRNATSSRRCLIERPDSTNADAKPSQLVCILTESKAIPSLSVSESSSRSLLSCTLSLSSLASLSALPATPSLASSSLIRTSVWPDRVLLAATMLATLRATPRARVRVTKFGIKIGMLLGK
ncbi:hypothetical protein FOIG_03310 [Fusarium odoratissimum NRRL 54006]|uniref:Uncharacterized protein n=1 Tax=Fusarium odoratissimum (strain NRRL 54006) TaxID=1089451 RepID=X0KCV5_FUSO5|nr:uncharacterized protein FOIG_03310 [Fusarium odoratissimum NRRL 54006]EXM06557.1 hypothetical protein FOIG_03310 [Fusarium odoratissimum NRRL 54006]